jgi:organic hydroperoxide reductase OsmC/OhrA
MEEERAMQIRARIRSGAGTHEATVATDGTGKTLAIPARAGMPGSGVNGGELLFLALATCYGNDLWREAAQMGIAVQAVEVEVDGAFGGPGEPARDVTYRARVVAGASPEQIEALMRHTDAVAEIQNTLRGGVAVTLAAIEAVPSGAGGT